jgi:iron(II)-dependent oxidoreductase
VRELNDRNRLIAALRDARDYTLGVYAHLDEAALRFPYARTVNPPLWELAHVAWFQEHWCLRWREGAARAPSLLENADPMLNSALIPHRARWELPQLTWPVVRDYLRRVLEATVARLERADPLEPYFPLLALFHEDMHAEAYRMSLQTLGLPGPRPRAAEALPAAVPLAAAEAVFEGGSFVMGSTPGADFVFDNELGAHAVRVAPFALAARTVTQAEYRAFVEDGGYREPRWWSEDGWRWRAAAAIEQPRDWRRDGASWALRRHDRLEPLRPDHPVMHVSAYEAEAYAAYAGARLPTEAEWEYAARFGLAGGADRYPWGDAPLPPGAANLDHRFGATVAGGALSAADSAAGLRQMLGNVWEWTATPFLPYPGFAPGPYKEYSQPWFGDHRVLRGGSFATRSRLVHNRWRNFYTPERSDAFAGIRLARSL